MKTVDFYKMLEEASNEGSGIILHKDIVLHTSKTDAIAAELLRYLHTNYTLTVGETVDTLNNALWWFTLLGSESSKE